jgi:hypothetical protein
MLAAKKAFDQVASRGFSVRGPIEEQQTLARLRASN